LVWQYGGWREWAQRTQAGGEACFEGTYAKFARRGQGFFQQGHGLCLVLGLATGQEHGSVVMLGMNQPRACARPGVHRQGLLEVLLRFVPMRHGGGEHPQVA
jgi:hypothetical protein